MTFDEAAAKLIDIDQHIAERDLTGVSERIEGESEDSRKLRTLIIRRYREAAAKMINDPTISDLEFNVLMSRLGFSDVRVLAQLQLTESE